MRQIFCGSRITRSVRCDKCGLHIAYNKSKGQTEVVCIKCGNQKGQGTGLRLAITDASSVGEEDRCLASYCKK